MLVRVICAGRPRSKEPSWHRRLRRQRTQARSSIALLWCTLRKVGHDHRDGRCKTAAKRQERERLRMRGRSQLLSHTVGTTPTFARGRREPNARHAGCIERSTWRFGTNHSSRKRRSVRQAVTKSLHVQTAACVWLYKLTLVHGFVLNTSKGKFELLRVFRGPQARNQLRELHHEWEKRMPYVAMDGLHHMVHVQQRAGDTGLQQPWASARRTRASAGSQHPQRDRRERFWELVDPNSSCYPHQPRLSKTSGNVITPGLEEILAGLLEPLGVVYTVDPKKVRARLSLWKAAAQKELNSLQSLGAIIRHSGRDAQR